MLTGRSGSGKSVFLRTLALLDAPSGGTLAWMDQVIGVQDIPRYRSQVCYLAQRAAMLGGSVADNLRYPFTLKVSRARHFDVRVAQALLLKAGKPAAFLDKAAAELSGGEAQIVALVRTLLLAPQVLLLDEPTAALDPQSTLAVEALVRHWFDEHPDARACVWITHDPDQAQRLATCRLSMDQGLLQAGDAP